ncbi:MAG: hypothetical protein Q7K55_06105 [Candidatus Levybacteria bacterium]|nr:hypothetical protein [Candidatus Levybacteria bacterium]
MNKKDYLTLDPSYPSAAFVCFFIIRNNSGEKCPIPMERIYTSIDLIMHELKRCIKEYAKMNYNILERMLLMPIALSKRIPLKREYWQKPTEHYDFLNKFLAFIKIFNEKVIDKKLLVTPCFHNVKKDSWIFNATLPFLENEEDIIEKVMLTSDIPVDESAKYTAVYNIGNFIIYDWKKKEYIDTEQENNFSDKN